MVNITKVYTRTGDDGTTNLVDFSRTDKNDSRLVVYADTDEANSHIGVAIATGELDEDVVAVLSHVQNDLFDVGSDIGNPIVEDPKYPPLRVEPDYVERLEQWCDEFNAELPNLSSFILPGGTLAASHLHVARTVVRRAERAAWHAIDQNPETTNVLTAKYLNRLSDLLFILGRVANKERGDVLWVPGGDRPRPERMRGKRAK